jgi:hypothetical protein
MILAFVALVGSLAVLFALEARDRAADRELRRAHAVLCSGRDCDIAPSVD